MLQSDRSRKVGILWHIPLESFLKNGPNLVSFCLFSFFSHDKYSTKTIKDKSIDGVLGT